MLTEVHREPNYAYATRHAGTLLSLLVDQATLAIPLRVGQSSFSRGQRLLTLNIVRSISCLVSNMCSDHLPINTSITCYNVHGRWTVECSSDINNKVTLNYNNPYFPHAPHYSFICYLQATRSWPRCLHHDASRRIFQDICFLSRSLRRIPRSSMWREILKTSWCRIIICTIWMSRCHLTKRGMGSFRILLMESVSIQCRFYLSRPHLYLWRI